MKAIKVVLFAIVAALLLAGPALAAPSKPDIVEVLEIKGEINEYLATQVTNAVEKINENPKIKAVVLFVDSPGGGASASAVIYQELGKIKVPVVGYCGYVCASGGAYALMSTSVKYVGVRDDSIGGSIGVIATMTRFNRLLEWAKIDNETFKSGLLKDSGNPTRAGTDADRVYFQSIIDQLAEKFYGVVQKSRAGHNALKWDEIKQARIFIGKDIVRVGLADQVMTFEQAVEKAKSLSGAKATSFTREELRKMTKDASEAANMSAPAPEGWLPRSMAHVDTLMSILAEIRSGESVKFAYRMPYQF